MIIVLGAAVVGVLVEAFVPRGPRHLVQVLLALVALAAAFVQVVRLGGTEIVGAVGSVAIDGPALFMQGTVLVLAFVSVMFFAERRIEGGADAFAPAASSLPGSEDERVLVRERVLQTEVYPLAMFSVGGMMLFPAANDLLMMFVALEILSLPLYLLCGMARRRRLLSQEAALKYFLLGAFASAFFLFGAAFVYGFSGSVRFSDIDAALGARIGQEGLLLAGVGLMAVGLLFKIGAVPFHAWTPDVYQGAPTQVTAFMAACTKLAAFGAMLRLFYVALGGVRTDWQPMLWAVAIVTMVVGIIVALTQTDVKRMLAYSSIAHAGFILTALVAVDQVAVSAILFYLATYGFTTLGAFAVVTLVRDAGGEATHLSKWAGLGKRSPLLAATFGLFLLALAGIPLTSGFVGKLAVFSAAFQGGAMPLVIVGVVTSAVAAFFYVRVIVLMFFSEPAAEGPSVAVPSMWTTFGIGVGVAATVLLGVMPGPLLDLAEQASVFIR
ncbi:NADH-quinone oxidoreductase subunit NuoN [Phytoactinopolyspora alkaliphila]|uniref:NADH-quinone oxidoreductase subunit N n=2 Tax=Phytoactinopolyspora alkaliphila TaxID=1783498 RepID=A0A6N9YHY5_9ACTN|nr:NADH-quinone oxidoreductase subunit NuoN [Phytoactinopolyspora alkaliphila]NED94508.1 NADH-quinone oxidoreductase subunit NuoN [Phytoactinopolyspora alkaliphila]